MAGIVIRDAHFPGRAPIDAYGNGGFRFAGMSHRGSILCIPSGIYGWAPRALTEVDAAALEKVLAEAAEIDVLLLGVGASAAAMPAALRSVLQAARITADAMTTGAAARTFNVLLAEDRRVAAALIAVD
ncbi:MAG: hypothetical protein KIS96_13670 [Bauldia sp.]|nr:hypothetical protein [Bauldia sp.]